MKWIRIPVFICFLRYPLRWWMKLVIWVSIWPTHEWIFVLYFVLQTCVRHLFWNRVLWCVIFFCPAVAVVYRFPTHGHHEIMMGMHNEKGLSYFFAVSLSVITRYMISWKVFWPTEGYQVTNSIRRVQSWIGHVPVERWRFGPLDHWSKKMDLIVLVRSSLKEDLKTFLILSYLPSLIRIQQPLCRQWIANWPAVSRHFCDKSENGQFESCQIITSGNVNFMRMTFGVWWIPQHKSDCGMLSSAQEV